MTLSESLGRLDDFLASYQKVREKERPTPVVLMIICPDCGKNPPFRKRCPKCGGDSWIPAGPVNGIFEWVKARQWRLVISPPPPVASREAGSKKPATERKRKGRRKRRKPSKRHR